MFTTAPTKQVATCSNRLLAERAKLQQWVERFAQLESQLATLQQTIGGAVLDDPTAAERLIGEQQHLRDQLDVAHRAADAQAQRIPAAEHAYLLAEAAALQPVSDQAEAVVAKHRARTAELLALLEQHEGRFVPEAELAAAQRRLGPGEVTFELTAPKSRALEERAEQVRRSIFILREMVEGREPTASVLSEWGVAPAEVYPPCVFGPDALVPSLMYLREVQVARERVEAESVAVSSRDATIAEIEERLAAAPEAVTVDRTAAAIKADREADQTKVKVLSRERVRAVDALAEAREVLAALVGSDDARV